MIRRSAPTALLLCCAALLIPGCGDPSSAEASPEPAGPLVIHLVNKSRSDVNGVVVSANIPVSFGKVARNDSETLTDKKLELTQRLEVDWSDSRGERHSETFHPQGTLGKNYRGPIRITLKPGGAADLSRSN